MSLFTFSALAAECKLTAQLESNLRIETSFQVSSHEGCKDLAEKTKHNYFFNLIEKEDRLIGTKFAFKDENLTTKETVLFKSEEESY